MVIKRYSGSDERVLLKKIRQDLGTDCVILHTYFQRRKGFFGFFARKHVEIVAGGGFQIVKDYSRARTPPPSDRVAAAYSVAPTNGQGHPRDVLSREVDEIKTLIKDIRTRMDRPKPSDCPEQLFEEYLTLTQNHVSDALAQKLITRLQEKVPPAELKERRAAREAIAGLIKEMVHCADGISIQRGCCRRVAFVGPTGVGKTTTLAKLLSIYHYRGVEVGVITSDTYRIAATEQIRRVAELVGVPVRVCRGERDVAAALEEFRTRDLILVDTAGRSQRHAKHMEELRQVLSWVKPDEIHLVASIATQPETLHEIIQRFEPCGFSRIVLTKLDEAVKMGLILDVLAKVNKELSFITTGQEIPRDIEIADADRIAALILGKEQL